MRESTSDGKRRTCFALFLVCMPILNQYMFFPLTCWEVMCVCATLFVFLTKKEVSRLTVLDRKYGLFCAYLIVSCFFIVLYDNQFEITLRLINATLTSFAVLFLIPDLLGSFSSFRYWYHRVMWVLSMVLIVQIIMYYAFGEIIYPYIPNMTLNYNDGVNSSILIKTSIWEISNGYYFRPSSLFLEPALYAPFSALGITFELFAEKFDRHAIVSALFFSVCSILTTSSLALVLCVVAWLCFLFFRKELWVSHLLGMLLIVLFVVPIIACFLVSQQGVLTSILIKISSLADLSVDSSTSVRLLRGLQYFKQMDFASQIFGVGYGGLTNYYFFRGIDIGNAGNQVSYMNGLSTILCSIGLIGFLLFVFFVLSSFFKLNKMGKTVIICLVFAMSVSDMFNSPTYFMFILTIFLLKKERAETINKGRAVSECSTLVYNDSDGLCQLQRVELCN